MAAQAIARVLSIVFWVFTYKELNTSDRSAASSPMPEYAGHCFLLAQCIHLLIMGDFLVYWINAMFKGVNVTLPSHVQ